MQAESEAIKDSSLKSAAPIAAADFADVPVYSIHDSAWAWLLYKFTQKLLLVWTYLFMYGFTRIKIAGRENLKGIHEGPLLIVANHKAYYDPPMIGLCFPFFSRIYPFRFMTSDDFFKKKASRWLYESMGCFPAYKGRGIDKSLAAPRYLLKKGETIIFFPEGRCVREDGLGQAKPGVGMLAAEFPEIPIIPMAITGTHKLRPFSQASINIGKPFTFNSLDSAKRDPLSIAQEIMLKISDLYEE